MSAVIRSRTRPRSVALACAGALAALAAAGPLAATAPAASTLTTAFQGAADEGDEGVPYALLTTTPGTRTDLSVRLIAAGWRFADAAGPMTVRGDSRCSGIVDAAGPAALCAADRVLLRGADGDDVLRADANAAQYPYPRVAFAGGEGDDVIVGGAEDDQVTVTAGHDAIDLGSGQDELVVAYPGPSAVDLRAGTATAASGSATLRGVEAVTGLRATIVGDDGDDTLTTNVAADGGPGDDVLRGDGTLRGGDGDDRITGAEALFGDAGDDTIVVDPVGRVFQDAPDPRVSCGPGDDRVLVDDGDDLRIQADCEHLVYRRVTVRPTPVRVDGGRSVAVAVRCAGCRGTLRVRTGRGLGRAVPYAVQAGKRVLRLPVPRGSRVRAGQLVSITMRDRRTELEGPVVWRTTVG